MQGLYDVRAFFVIYCLNNLKYVVFSCFFLRNILRNTYYFTTFVIQKRNNNKKQ